MSGSDYIARLSQALAGAGIRGEPRARIVSEFEDHLASNPDADLGEPRKLATQFADELGTDLARRAALRAFGALAFAGILFAIAFVTAGRVHSSAARGATSAVGGLASVVAHNHPSTLTRIAMSVCLVAVQLSVAAGLAGLARAIRLRAQPVMATEEAVMLVRRAAVALGSGAVGLLVLPLVAATLPQLSSSWKVLAYVAAAIGLISIAAVVPAVGAALRLKPRLEGPAGDLVDDLNAIVPLRLPGSPWKLAILLVVGIAVVLTAAGIVQGDPYDGALRGLADGLACLTGFAVLGRYLGLRSDSSLASLQ
jgi:MFS family permease